MLGTESRELGNLATCVEILLGSPSARGQIVLTYCWWGAKGAKVGRGEVRRGENERETQRETEKERDKETETRERKERHRKNEGQRKERERNPERETERERDTETEKISTDLQGRARGTRT